MEPTFDPRVRSQLVYCAGCGDILDESPILGPEGRRACPACGSLKRKLVRPAEGVIQIDDGVTGRLDHD
jgi:hypothetical protein